MSTFGTPSSLTSPSSYQRGYTHVSKPLDASIVSPLSPSATVPPTSQLDGGTAPSRGDSGYYSQRSIRSYSSRRDSPHPYAHSAHTPTSSRDIETSYETGSGAGSSPNSVCSVHSIHTPPTYSRRTPSSYWPRSAAPSPLRLRAGTEDESTSVQSRSGSQGDTPTSSTSAPSGLPAAGPDSVTATSADSDTEAESVNRAWESFAASGIDTGQSPDLSLGFQLPPTAASPGASASAASVGSTADTGRKKKRHIPKRLVLSTLRSLSTAVSTHWNKARRAHATADGSYSASPTDDARTHRTIGSGDVLPDSAVSNPNTGTQTGTSARSYTNFSRPFRPADDISAHTPASGYTGGAGLSTGGGSGPSGGHTPRSSRFSESESENLPSSPQSIFSRSSRRIKAKRNELRTSVGTYSRVSSFVHRHSRNSRAGEQGQSSGLGSPAAADASVTGTETEGVSVDTRSRLSKTRDAWRSRSSIAGSSAGRGKYSDSASEVSSGISQSGASRAGFSVSRLRAKLSTGIGTGTGTGARQRPLISAPFVIPYSLGGGEPRPPGVREWKDEWDSDVCARQAPGPLDHLGVPMF